MNNHFSNQDGKMSLQVPVSHPSPLEILRALRRSSVAIQREKPDLISIHELKNPHRLPVKSISQPTILPC